MPGFDHSVLTDVGWDALTDAEAGQHIEYTHLEAGDGYVYGGDSEIFGMTALKHKVMNFPITNFSNDGQGQITLIGVISSQNVTTGFHFREIGVCCTIDGGPSILYAVANAGDDADYMPSSAETGAVIQTVQIIIKIDRATNVTVIVQAGLDVTCQNIGPATVGPGWFRDKQGQICFFKRLNSPNKTILVSETSDIVSIDTPTINQNLDMWVALGNPDIFPNFSTIGNALAYLRKFEIANAVWVTITVSAGVWNNSPTITVNHPQGSQIVIRGTALPDKAVTSATSAGGSKVRLNAPAGRFSDINVGDYIIYNNMSTAAAMCVAGIWQVLTVAADGSNLTYDGSFFGTVPNLASAPGGTVSCLKTVISFASGVDGIIVQNEGLGTIEKMALRGNGGTGIIVKGLYVKTGVCVANRIGAYAWYGAGGGQESFGIGCVGGAATLYCNTCAACKCYNGFHSQSSSYLSLTFCFGNSNTLFGIRGEGGDVAITNGAGCCNGNSGVVCSAGASLGLNTVYGFNNATWGLICQFNGNVNLGPISGGAYTGNLFKDIGATYVSSIIRGSGPAIQYGTSNIAPNTLSWDGCIFFP